MIFGVPLKITEKWIKKSKTSNFPAGMGVQLCFVGQMVVLDGFKPCEQPSCVLVSFETSEPPSWLKLPLSLSLFHFFSKRSEWSKPSVPQCCLIVIQQQLGWFTHPMVVQCLIFWFGVFLIPLTLPHGSRKHRCWFFFITNQFRLL